MKATKEPPTAAPTPEECLANLDRHNQREQQDGKNAAMSDLFPRLWILRSVVQSLSETGPHGPKGDPNGWGRSALEVATEDLITAAHRHTSYSFAPIDGEA